MNVCGMEKPKGLDIEYEILGEYDRLCKPQMNFDNFGI